MGAGCCGSFWPVHLASPCGCGVWQLGRGAQFRYLTVSGPWAGFAKRRHKCFVWPMTNIHEEARSGDSCRERLERPRELDVEDGRKEKRLRLSTAHDAPELVPSDGLLAGVQDQAAGARAACAEYPEPAGRLAGSKGQTVFTGEPVKQSVCTATGLPGTVQLGGSKGNVLLEPGLCSEDVAIAATNPRKAALLTTAEPPFNRLQPGVAAIHSGAIPQEYYSIPAVQLPQGMQAPILVDPNTMLTILGQQATTKFAMQADGPREVIAAQEPGDKVRLVVGAAAQHPRNRAELLASHGLHSGIHAPAEKVPGIVQLPVLMAPQVYAPSPLVASATTGTQIMHPGVHPQLQLGAVAAPHDVHPVSIPMVGQMGCLPVPHEHSIARALAQELPLQPQEPLPKTTVRGLLQVYSDEMRYIFFTSQRALYGDSAWDPGEFHYTDLSEAEKHGSPIAQRFVMELINRLKSG